MEKFTSNANDYIGEDRHLNDEGVSFFADALLLGKEAGLPEKLRDHVETCQDCKTEIMALYSIMQAQDSSKLGPHPYFEEGVLKKTASRSEGFMSAWRIAAVLALVLISAFAIYFFGVLKEPQLAHEETVAPKQEQPGPEEQPGIAEELLDPRELYAANFEPSPNLEDLADQMVRATMIRVLAPENGVQVGKVIEFRWQVQIADQLTLKILNNREETLHSFTPENDRQGFEHSLEAGLYYWKLETEDDLLYVGKFFVSN